MKVTSANTSLGSRLRAASLSTPRPPSPITPALNSVSKPSQTATPPPEPKVTKPIPTQSTAQKESSITEKPSQPTDSTLGPDLRKIKTAPTAPTPTSGSFSKKASWLFGKLSKGSASPSPSPARSNTSSPDITEKQKRNSVSAATLRDLDSNFNYMASSIVKHDVKVLNPKVNGKSSPIPIANSTKKSQESPSESLDSAKSSFLANTFRKFKSGQDTPPTQAVYARVVLNVNKNKPRCDIDEIKNLNLYRVRFVPETYKGDPPQQIPARAPKPGTIKITEEGYIIRPHNAGDTVNPGKAYKVSSEAATITAYNSAALIANIVKNDQNKWPSMPKLGKSSSTAASEEKKRLEEELEASFAGGITIGQTGTRTRVKIDTPMHDSVGFPSRPKVENAPQRSGLSELYTKCCHVREILPINATLNQLEGQSGTLPYLRLVNPRPTLIEVLAFSDFISIVPIHTVAFDNLDLTEEMFRNLLTSLSRSTSLQKLSFSNANITQNMWKVLCAFLVTNKSLLKLDVSVTGPQNGKKPIKYKQLPLCDRSELNWKLFTKTLVSHGGLEELVLNGCLVPHDDFVELISKGCSIATKRLGVASSDLQECDLTALSKWTTQENCVCEGIDLGGNDLSKCTGLLSTLFSVSTVTFISLNSCKLSDADLLGEIFERQHVTSKVKFLDFSYNPDIFPKFIPYMEKYMPHLSSLRRIHLDFNNLKSSDVIKLAEAFAQCPLLSHISLFGNRNINEAALESIAIAVKLSRTITCVDIDSDLVPANISRRISHYCLQNMEAFVEPIEMEEMFGDEGELLDNGTSVANAVRYVLKANKKKPASEVDLQLVADGLFQRANVLRDKVRIKLEQCINEADVMTPDLRDKMIKLYHLEATLERALARYDLMQRKHAKPTAQNNTLNVLRHLDKAESLLAVAKERGRYPVTDAENNQISGNAPYDESATGDFARMQESDPNEVDPVHMLLSNSLEDTSHDQMRKFDREEGDFHKLGVFIQQNKSTHEIISTTTPSGPQLRQFVLTESNSAAASIHESEGIMTPGSHIDSHGGTAPGTPSGHHEDPDIEKFISKLKGMSDDQVHMYFQTVYGKLGVEDEETDNSLSTESEDDSSR